MPPEGVSGGDDVVVTYVDDLEFFIDGVSREDAVRILCLQIIPGVFRVLEA